MHSRFEPSMALSQEMLDFQLSPSRSAKDAVGVLNGMGAATKDARADPSLLVETDIRYGARPRQKLDVFRPKTAAGPCPSLVFIHGGFWQEGDKGYSGFTAQSMASLGWASVSIGYTLTPEVSLSELTQEVHAALTLIHTQADALGIDPGHIVLAGHSAGGHLAASILADVLGTGAHEYLAGAVLISGVYELNPIAKSYVNDLARITEEEQRTLSPARYRPAASLPVHLLIGADEPDAFQVQTDALHALWGPYLPHLTRHVAPGRDHFDVLDVLNDPASDTAQAILAMGPDPMRTARDVQSCAPKSNISD